MDIRQANLQNRKLLRLVRDIQSGFRNVTLSIEKNEEYLYRQLSQDIMTTKKIILKRDYLLRKSVALQLHNLLYQTKQCEVNIQLLEFNRVQSHP